MPNEIQSYLQRCLDIQSPIFSQVPLQDRRTRMRAVAELMQGPIILNAGTQQNLPSRGTDDSLDATQYSLGYWS